MYPPCMFGTRQIEGRAKELMAAGSPEKALDLLRGMPARRSTRSLERLTLEARHQAFRELASTISNFGPWPPEHDSRFETVAGVPEIDYSELTVDALRAGVIGRGALVVRGLFDANSVKVLARAVRSTFREYDRSDHGRTVSRRSRWLDPHTLGTSAEQRHNDRRWVRKASGVLAADSPRSLAQFLAASESSGAIQVIEEYLGERAALSVMKTTLRMVSPQRNVEHAWHQDGAFLGRDVRSLNMWVALSECGQHAPTIQMLTRRTPEILGSGGSESIFSWSMSTSDVEQMAGDEGIAWLHFNAGDVVFFDHLNLHSTAVRDGMTEDRLAIEAWFFAPSAFPEDRIPLLV